MMQKEKPKILAQKARQKITKNSSKTQKTSLVSLLIHSPRKISWIAQYLPQRMSKITQILLAKIWPKIVQNLLKNYAELAQNLPLKFGMKLPKICV